jgi:tetratricopeptide (TPR) repeat protein
MLLIQLKNRMKPAMILLVCLLPLTAFGQDPYLLGVARLQDRSYEAARDYFKQVLATDSDDPMGLLNIAETYYQTNDYQDAIGYLERLEAKREGMGCYLLAKTYAQLGDAAMAALYLEKHLRSNYKLPSGTILLDEAFISLENSPEWKSLWKNNWYSEDEVLFQEISYLTRTGDHLEALDMIDQALGRAADRALLLAARGAVFHQMGNYQNSIKAYTSAIDLTRMNAEPFYGRAQSYLALGKFQDAIPDLNRTLQLQPERLEILKELSEANRAAGNFDQATRFIENYIQYFPRKAEAHYLHGQILFESGKYLKALSSFNRCLELETNDPRFYAARGQTYLVTRTYRYALNDFGMALDLDPKNHEVWYQKGLARWYSNDPEGSRADWEKATRYGSEKAAKKIEELISRQ